MKVIHLVLGVCLGVVGTGARVAQAQTQAMPAARVGQYNKAAETSVSGTVTAIEAQHAQTLPRGTYLTLRSGGSLLTVHMGLYSQKSLPFKTGAQVTVIGALATVNGSKIFLAREVQSSGRSTVIRSSNGFVLRPHSDSSSQGLQP